MNVPKIRFSEFTSEYKKYKFKDVATLYRGSSPRPIINFITKSDDGVNWIKIGDVNENDTYINKTSEKITVEGSKKSRKVYKNDIILSNSMSFGRPYILNIDGCIHDGWFVVRDYNEKLVQKYLYHFMSSPVIQKQYKKLSAGGVVSNISSDLVYSVDINIPSKEEQIKVSSFLSLIDKKIELQSKKIEDLKLFKLSQINQIKNDDSYKKIPLKDILMECNEKTTVNNQYEILSSTAKGIFLQSEYFNKQAASENNIGYKILKRNQLVLSPQNLWMGNININNKYEIGIVSPSYKIFDIKTDIVNIDYFKNWIKSPRALYEYMISSEQGASIVRRNLNMDLFGEITISVPNMNEQNKIGRILSLIDSKISLEESKYSKLSELKKGLMQDMFV